MRRGERFNGDQGAAATVRSQVSQAQARVLEELRADLDKQLASDWAMPAVLSGDADGQLSPKTLMPLDIGGRPISDAQMGELIRGALESKGDDVAVLAWVRIDVNPPEIISADFASGLVCTMRPCPKEDGTLDWMSETSATLDERPRGGSGADEGAVLMRSGYREHLDARAALDHIGGDAIARLEREVEAGEVVSTEDVAEETTFDLGDLWGHGEVPPRPATLASLGARLRQLRDHTRSLETTTTVFRFRHEASIYLFGLYLKNELESGFLLKTAVLEPRKLAELEEVAGAELARLLGLGGAAERG
jgi:hypothetical protein